MATFSQSWQIVSRSNPALRRWFRLINRVFFDSLLPNNVCVRWADAEEVDKSEDERYFGWCYYSESSRRYVIVLSRKNNPKLSGKLAVLAHEMCHVATELRDDHGPAFERWRQYIADRGIFKKGAVAKGLTLF